VPISAGAPPNQVVRGELVEQLDVGHQAGAGEHAFEQVVAEQRVVGHAACHRGLEGVEVVDALARVAPLPEQVLVDVRYREGVRVDSGGSRERPLEDRCVVLGRERRGDARLEDPVAPRHPPDPRIEGRLVERVGDRPDEARHGAPGKPGVGVERDHVPHVRRRGGGGPPGEDPGRRRAAQKGVELVELAALALPAHPATLGLVPRPSAVEQQEPRTASRGLLVALVEPVDRRRRGGEELVVARHVLGRGVEPVRKQGEPDVALAVSQVVDLETETWASASASLVRSIGTTTSDRSRDGTPSTRSRRGSGRGPSALVTQRLTSAIARSEAGASATIVTTRTPRTPAPAAPGDESRNGTARMSAVTSASVPT
jgi:hypothetical protein